MGQGRIKFWVVRETYEVKNLSSSEWSLILIVIDKNGPVRSRGRGGIFSFGDDNIVVSLQGVVDEWYSRVLRNKRRKKRKAKRLLYLYPSKLKNWEFAKKVA